MRAFFCKIVVGKNTLFLDAGGLGLGLGGLRLDILALVTLVLPPRYPVGSYTLCAMRVFFSFPIRHDVYRLRVRDLILLWGLSSPFFSLAKMAASCSCAALISASIFAVPLPGEGPAMPGPGRASR